LIAGRRRERQMSVREPFSPLLMNFFPLDLALEKAMEHANGQQLFFYARYAGDLVFKVLDLGPRCHRMNARYTCFRKEANLNTESRRKKLFYFER
jgi:hypothetical protein